MNFYHSIFLNSKKSLFALVCISIVFTVFFLQKWFLNYDFSINQISNFMFSEATAHGIQISSRISFFYRIIFSGLILFVLILTLLHYLQIKWKLEFEKYTDLSFISLIYITFSWLQIMEIQTRFVLDTLFILICFKLLLIFIFNYFNKSLLSLLNPSDLLKSSLIAFLLLFIVFFLFGQTNFVNKQSPLIFSVLTYFVLFSPTIVHKIFSPFKGDVFHLYLPISLAPWLAFLILETNFYVKQNSGNFMPYKWIFCLLFLCFIAIYFTLKHYKKEWNWIRISESWFPPSILFSFILLAYYSPVIPHDAEMFEMANPANTLLNIHKFGEIPLFDFMTSHMFSEQWYGLIYTSIFGLNYQLDFYVYEFLNIGVFLFILYFFIHKITQNRWFSVLFILVFPFNHSVFFPAVFMGILPFLFLLNGKKLTNWKTYYILMLICTFLLFWRIDTGVVGILATLFFIPIYLFVTHTKLPLKAILQSFLAMIITIAIGIGFSMFFKTWDELFINFKIALHYIAASQAHGYFQISSFFTHQFYTIHVLLPFVGGFILLYCIYYLRKNSFSLKNTDHKLLLSIIFLLLLFFANAQRGLVRHGFAEQDEFFFISTFVAACSLFIVHRYRKLEKHYQLNIFFISSFLLFLTVIYFPYKPEKTHLEKAIRQTEKSTISVPYLTSNYTGRMERNLEFSKNTYLDLKRFLDLNLNKNQTFLDFSNSPMLYFYCQRKVPGYFNQNLQNSVDDFLFDALLNSISIENVPVIVFHSVPKSWFDATDGIPNEVRYYKIAEFIHQNYSPFSVINGKSIWVSKKSNFNWKNKVKIPVEKYQIYDYKQLPAYYATFVSTNKTSWEKAIPSNLFYTDSNITFEIEKHPTTSPQYLFLEVDKDFRIQEYNQWIRLNNLNDSTFLQLNFLRVDSVSLQYLFRLTNLEFWNTPGMKTLEFPAKFGIKQIRIVKE
jgi:hypothetical protein